MPSDVLPRIALVAAAASRGYRPSLSPFSETLQSVCSSKGCTPMGDPNVEGGPAVGRAGSPLRPRGPRGAHRAQLGRPRLQHQSRPREGRPQRCCPRASITVTLDLLDTNHGPAERSRCSEVANVPSRQRKRRSLPQGQQPWPPDPRGEGPQSPRPQRRPEHAPGWTVTVPETALVDPSVGTAIRMSFATLMGPAGQPHPPHLPMARWGPLRAPMALRPTDERTTAVAARHPGWRARSRATGAVHGAESYGSRPPRPAGLERQAVGNAEPRAPDPIGASRGVLPEA